MGSGPILTICNKGNSRDIPMSPEFILASRRFECELFGFRRNLQRLITLNYLEETGEGNDRVMSFLN
jgi:hypothetical protein